MNPTARTVRTAAAAASTVYGALLYLLGLHPNKDLRYAFAYLPAVFGYAVIAFDKWVWRWPGIDRVTGHPRIHGTWRTTLAPTAESHIPAGGNRGPIRAYLTIEQSFWTVNAALRTAESSSRSSGATIVKTDGSGISELLFLYANTPQAAHQQRSPRHTGACRLSVTGRSPSILQGRYYTDRFTAGDMELVLVDRRTDYGTFDQAQAADPNP
jgi:hypothetical protein